MKCLQNYSFLIIILFFGLFKTFQVFWFGLGLNCNLSWTWDWYTSAAGQKLKITRSIPQVLLATNPDTRLSSSFVDYGFARLSDDNRDKDPKERLTKRENLLYVHFDHWQTSFPCGYITKVSIFFLPVIQQLFLAPKCCRQVLVTWNTS